MRSIWVLRTWLAAAVVCAPVQLAGPARAEPAPGPPAPATTDPDRNSPAYTASVDTRLTVRPDLTAVATNTVRYKILRESAIRTLGQQNLSYVESLSALEVIEAYTEKRDGRKIAVDQGHILTRDAATGLNAVYQRDAMVKTLIFPDVEVGDTLVYVTKVNKNDKRFPGHFNHQQIFSRSVPYETSQLTVDAPRSLGLRVHVRGDGLAHETIEAGEDRRHKFSYRPEAWRLEEPGAVSIWDREPQLVITTFKDPSELGASYWSSMKDQDAVDAGILALAEEITKGIGDRRAQAVAIDRWVKTNIRYVLVFLGSGGITPNPAQAVLKNKFGDCKDHVVLMGALLRAKAIASEQVLINVGSAYRLPELPTPFFNHVMLYLPEFDLYPTRPHRRRHSASCRRTPTTSRFSTFRAPAAAWRGRRRCGRPITSRSPRRRRRSGRTASSRERRGRPRPASSPPLPAAEQRKSRRSAARSSPRPCCALSAVPEPASSSPRYPPIYRSPTACRGNSACTRSCRCR
jgi:hypothetical protein